MNPTNPATVPTTALTRTCRCCGKDRPNEGFPSKIAAGCTHEVQDCRKCIRNWVKSMMTHRLVTNFDCFECNELMTRRDVKRHTSKEMFEVYDARLTRATLNADSNHYWCPSTSCEGGGVLPNVAEDPMLTCSTCGLRSCVVCATAWHEGQTHEENRARRPAERQAEEEASAAAVAAESKACPGLDCGSRVQKISGCNNVTCTICHTVFCWGCLAVGRSPGIAHRPGCLTRALAEARANAGVTVTRAADVQGDREAFALVHAEARELLRGLGLGPFEAAFGNPPA